VTPAVVRPGQAVFVQVCDPSGHPYARTDARITIQGIESTSRYYQFPRAGTYKLLIRAVKGGIAETATATIQVAGNPLEFRRTLGTPVQTSMPLLQVAQDLGHPYRATFSLGNPPSKQIAKEAPPAVPSIGVAAATKTAAPAESVAKESPVRAPDASLAPPAISEVSRLLAATAAEHVTRIAPVTVVNSAGAKVTGSGTFARQLVVTTPMKPAATSYKWDFGDGTQIVTQSPIATHDYAPAIQSSAVAYSFHVSCTIVHDSLTVQRTLVLYSAYGLCRQLGTIVPRVTGDVYATNQRVAFSASLIVQNLEAQDITLNKMACVPLSTDPDANLPSPKFTPMTSPVTIRASSASGLGVYVPMSLLEQSSKLGPGVPGYAVYYGGVAADGKTPVRFSHVFRIRLSDSGMAYASVAPRTFTQLLSGNETLKAVSAITNDAKRSISKPGELVIDAATSTVAIALSASPHDAATAAQVSASVQAGLTSVAVRAGVLGESGGFVRGGLNETSRMLQPSINNTRSI
jgi:hypothetical protein